jgi:translation elongation factor EF-G
VKVHDSKDIRNVGVAGHCDSGKTSLTQDFLGSNTKVTEPLFQD